MKALIFTITCLIILLPGVLLAQQGQPKITLFQSIPFVEGNNVNTETFVQALYTLAIALAAFIAVLKIIGAGVKYALSEVVTSKEEAKKDIQNALLGLIIILAAVTILNTVNPNLTNLSALRNADPININAGGRSQSSQQPFQPNNLSEGVTCYGETGCPTE